MEGREGRGGKGREGRECPANLDYSFSKDNPHLGFRVQKGRPEEIKMFDNLWPNLRIEARDNFLNMTTVRDKL